MKKLAFFLIIFLAPLIRLEAAVTRSGANGLQELISTIFEDFRGPARVYNLTLGNVVFSETLLSHVSNGNKDIVIRLSEISGYTKGENDLFKRLFVEYVIAHEIGHKVQFSGFRREVIEAARGEGSVFLECDADILAGLIMTGEINTVEVPRLQHNDPSFDLAAYSSRNNDAMFGVYERIFEMDQKNISINTHPSHIQRLRAIRDGMELGMCTIMAFVTGDSPEVTNAKDLYKTIGDAINFDPARDNPLVWAHSEAILITNENNSLARHLTRYDSHVQRVRGSGESHFGFSFKIYNENPVSVRFSCRVYSSVKPRTNQREIVKNVPLASQAFDQVIPAGSSMQFAGAVNYIAEAGYTTTLTLPGDPESLYFVMDSNNPLTDPTPQESNDNNFTIWGAGTLDNIDDHIKDMYGKSDQFSNYTKGIAVSDDSVLERVMRNTRRLQPTFKAGLEDDQEFVYNARNHKLFYQFYACESTDSNEAAAHFQEINEKIRRGYAGALTPGTVETDEFGASERFVASDGRAKIRTFLQKNYVGDDYVVQIIIEGK